MMNAMQFAIDKIDEECKEVALMCNKIKQFGLDSNNCGQLPLINREMLFKELNDLIGSIIYANMTANLGYEINEAEVVKKIKKIHHFHNASKELGLCEK